MELLVTIIIVIPMSLLRGWVLTKMWLWFVTPFGVGPITIFHAIGISILLGMLTRDADIKENSAEEKVKRIVYGFLVPIITLVMGWVVHSLM